jgi:sugar-specific transcriptional regulator TrmB
MDDEIHRSLEEVGSRFDFGEYEARAYVTILEHGSMTASEVADNADIPQPRVYDTVRSLADIGLVELHESRPMRVVAVDPEQAFSSVQTTLDDLVSALSERFRQPARDSEVVSLVKSRQTILRYLEDAISSAEYELILALSPALLGDYEELLKERRDAGVTIELLVAPATEIPDPAVYDYQAVSTRAKARRGVTTPVVAVADGTYSVYTPQATLDGDRNGDSYGVIFNRSELGFLVSAFLNTVVWPSAKRLTESTRSPTYPRRYATVRRCVADLTLQDGSFYATVRGRDVETGDSTTVRGSITDLSLSTNRETAAMTLETADGNVDIGGQLAALEDIEAYEIAVGYDEPPALDAEF